MPIKTANRNPRQPRTSTTENARLLPPSTTGRCDLSMVAPTLGHYYVYSSGPKLAPMDRPKYKRNEKPRGAHDYHSMMWDPRIYRGPTYKSYIKSEKERCDRKKLEDNESNNNQRKKGAKRNQQHSLGGIVRPKTPTHHSNKVGLEDMGIQTERFLEEITDEVIEKEMCTQTDYIFDLSVAIPLMFCPIKLGVDAGTQIEPWELFEFDEEARPIITTVVGKIIEQALLETMEEAELESLLAEQRAYEEKHRIELMRMQRLQQREQKVTEERVRLIQQRIKQVEQEKETEDRVGANLYTINYLGGIANGVLNELRREGFMISGDGLEESFIPWLHSRSIWATQIKESATTLLDDVIQSVVEKREAEVTDGIWREISAHKQNQPPLESAHSYNLSQSVYSEDYDAE